MTTRLQRVKVKDRANLPLQPFVGIGDYQYKVESLAEPLPLHHSAGNCLLGPEPDWWPHKLPRLRQEEAITFLQTRDSSPSSRRSGYKNTRRLAAVNKTSVPTHARSRVMAIDYLFQTRKRRNHYRIGQAENWSVGQPGP